MALAIKRQLDLKGLASPLPLARTEQAMKDMFSGELIEILATDVGSVRDFARWARSTGDDLLESSQLGNVFRFVLRKR